jgi:hypothetical protein
MIQILQATDAEAVMSFENSLNPEPDMEWTMQSWTAPWRRESLDHHLPLGWSFGIWTEQRHLRGYFIAQPLLFLDRQTQALWVENVQAQSAEDFDLLCETAIKLGREKHLQRVYFPKSASQRWTLPATYKAESWGADYCFVKTVK